jgi:hypothetical protein
MLPIAEPFCKLDEDAPHPAALEEWRPVIEERLQGQLRSSQAVFRKNITSKSVVKKAPYSLNPCLVDTLDCIATPPTKRTYYHSVSARNHGELEHVP